MDDGWYETNPDGGIVTLKEAPRSSGMCPDVIQIFFLDRSAPLPETQVYKMRGIIKPSRSMKGRFSTAQPIVGRLVEPQPLVGKIVARKDLRASITSKQTIRAKIRVCA